MTEVELWRSRALSEAARADALERELYAIQTRIEKLPAALIDGSSGRLGCEHCIRVGWPEEGFVELPCGDSVVHLCPEHQT